MMPLSDFMKYNVLGTEISGEGDPYHIIPTRRLPPNIRALLYFLMNLAHILLIFEVISCFECNKLSVA
jgi:hypothetical protein